VADVYREQFDFVYRCAARLGGPALEPEDVAQEVFLIVRRKLRTIDGSCKLITWLYGITLHVARRLRQKARRQARFKRSVTEEPVAHTPEVFEAHRTVYQILDQLAPKKRDVFILAELEGLPCDEIATIVGVKIETVWSRLHDARREFAAHLARRECRSESAPVEGGGQMQTALASN
jgi:RNA polymerase sigma-70 factor (ECF subfamily)